MRRASRVVARSILALGCLTVVAWAGEAPTRSPQVAIDFVNTFNAELGLNSDAIARKNKHIASNASHLLAAMPALFYQDMRGPFAALSKVRDTNSPSGLLVGDAHLGNLMTFTEPENGTVVWGWVDLDKSGVGLLDWDLERLATHTVISARLSAQNFSADDERELVAAVFEGYTKRMRHFLNKDQRPHAFLIRSDLRGALADLADKAGEKTQKRYLKHHVQNGVLVDTDPANEQEKTAIVAAVKGYGDRLAKNAPVARPLEIIGMGIEPPSKGGSNSGLVKYLVLLAPIDDKHPPALLKLKQLIPSALDGSTGVHPPVGARAVENVSILRGFADPMLGYATMFGHPCLVTSMTAGRDILDPEKISKADFLILATSAGDALARSHLQDPSLTPQRVQAWIGAPASDPPALARLHKLAVAYAEQTNADAKALKKSLKDGQ